MVKTKIFDVSDEELVWVDELVSKHGNKKEEVIQILRHVQEHFNFIPRKVQIRLSQLLDITLSEIYSIVTFYTFFSLKPKGKYQISCCKGTACYVRGADKVIEKLTQYLKIKPGDTTDDGLFSIDIIRCLGACGLGPVMTINDDVYARLKPEDVPRIISRYEPPFKDYDDVMKEQEQFSNEKDKLSAEPKSKLAPA
ncbi:MAG: NAD(P)H-dependent oxidoreductase subunit E [Tepidanaerobacteraceae bacterium]|nr:NAD(P)H-dependent oxidoreductase subunit E [Tepidanaerobacteraceae bacterium]